MRTIERRLAAVENRIRPADAGFRVFVIPRHENEAAFRAQCRSEARGARCMFIQFVAPGAVRRSEALH